MYSMGELWNVHSTVQVCITTFTGSIPEASQILHIPVFKLDGLHCIFRPDDFGSCHDKTTIQAIRTCLHGDWKGQFACGNIHKHEGVIVFTKSNLNHYSLAGFVRN